MIEQQVQPRRFISIQIKLLVAFTLLFTVVFAAAYYWFYNFATEKALTQIGRDLENTLKGGVDGINADQLQALYLEGKPRADGYTDDPRYWEQVAWMATVQEIEPRAILYTYAPAPGGANEVIFITSGSSVWDPPFGAKFLEPFDDVTPLEEGGGLMSGLVAPTLKLEPYTDDFGNWVSGYTPIRNSRGEIFAGLGIDFRADYVFEVQQAIRDRVVLAFAITYLILFGLVYVISKTLTQPILALTQAAERIGEGDYSQDLSALSGGAFRDEINTLSQVFEIMVGKVRKREETLKQQVAELKIEVDEAKRKKQVNEIVETDFFQDLQAKARDIRQQNRQRRQSRTEADETSSEEIETQTSTD